jgi:hypothetical protein
MFRQLHIRWQLLHLSHRQPTHMTGRRHLAATTTTACCPLLGAFFACCGLGFAAVPGRSCLCCQLCLVGGDDCSPLLAWRHM